MKRSALCLAVAAVAAVPGIASADYLYNAMPPDRMPYVMVIMDNSYSMNQTDGNQYGFHADGRPRSRLDAARSALTRILDDPTLEGVGIGFVHFYPNNRAIDLNGNGTTAYSPDVLGAANAGHSELGRACGACLIAYPNAADGRQAIRDELAVMRAEADTALAISVEFAGKMLRRIGRGYATGTDVDGENDRQRESSELDGETADTDPDTVGADPQAKCRDYYVILMTDGQDTCTRSATDCSLTSPFGATPACALTAGRNATVRAIQELLNLHVHAGDPDRKLVRTVVIGFVPGNDAALVNDLNAYARAGHMSYDAASDSFPCQGLDHDDTCNTGSALIARTEAELVAAFNKAFEAALAGEFTGASPIIASVPQKTAEVGRVARNFLSYGGFRMPGTKGILYGIKLFEENGDLSGDFQFTDLRRPADGGPLDLISPPEAGGCGAAGNPCVFEAGYRLTQRVAGGSSDRTIFTAVRDDVHDVPEGTTVVLERRRYAITPSGGGQFNTAWASYLTIPTGLLAPLDATGGALNTLPPSLLDPVVLNTGVGPLLTGSITGAQLAQVGHWLHGLPEDAGNPFGRKWALGDIVHSSVAFIDPPNRPYRDPGFAEYRNALAKRPTMIYVGANDGMIHAFYAQPDLQNLKLNIAPRWQAGDEAWAYLPPSQMANTVVNVLGGKDRFYSEDLSCRADDVRVYPDATSTMSCDASGQCTCPNDPDDPALCGWRTVLVCGQGWGGSWISAVDVTKPDDPLPMWEFTDFSRVGDQGLGRTWSAPTIGPVHLNVSGTTGKVTWLAVFGNGYNSDYKNCTSTNGSGTACMTGVPEFYTQALNLPFTGRYVIEGDGTKDDVGNVWALDVATGYALKKFSAYDMGNIIADVPLLDLDNDRLIDTGYPAGWGGSGGANVVNRIYFPKKTTAGTPVVAGTVNQTRLDAWGICDSGDAPIAGQPSRPFTLKPAAFAHPVRSGELYLFAGTGVEQVAGGIQHPDLQANNGNQWEMYAKFTEDDGTANCRPTEELCDEDVFALGRHNGERLLGSPTFVRQADGRDVVSYTTYVPPERFCDLGEAFLWSVDVTKRDGCFETTTSIGSGPPAPTPASADGQLYVIGDNGLNRLVVDPPPADDGGGGGGDAVFVDNNSGTAVLDEEDDDPPGPNTLQPRIVTVSWREIF